jgi:hypothetical protein
MIFFLYFLLFFTLAGKPKVLGFWLKISSMLSSKTILSEKVCKTGGSRIVSILFGTICDEKKIILFAAFPGVFLIAKKYTDFSPNL